MMGKPSIGRRWFDKQKHSMFPNIKDWTGHQEHLRYANPNDLDYWTWAFFHPSCYKIASYGTNVSTLLIFSAISWWGLARGRPVISLVSLVVAVGGLTALIKNIKNREMIKETTFYDLWMRE